MAINLLDIQPHKVSRDLSGYITFIYGPAKVGKTTFGSKMPGHLLLAFERGYNALPGVKAIDVTTWGEMKQIVRELKKPEVKEIYKSIIVDTADVAADACQKYICNQLGIENIGDGGWSTNGWAKYKKEFEDTFRTLTQLGYAVVFISHEKEKTVKLQNNVEYQQIGSSMQTSAMAIVENMSDIIGYAHPKVMPDDSLTAALNDAIDKEANETNNLFVTNERQATPVLKEYDYDALTAEFQDIVGGLMNKNPQHYGPRITQIVDKYLGKGKKVAEATLDQAEFISLIVDEIKSDLMTE